MKVAFVASTLPALFLKKNIVSFDLNLIVCGNQNLVNSYSFLKEVYAELNIIACVDKSQLLKLFENYDFRRIIIFHECCWPELDKILIKSNINVEYFPCVTLESLELVTNYFKTFFDSFFAIFLNKDFNFFVFVYHLIFHSRIFNIYKMRLDGEDNKYTYVTALKYEKYGILANKKCIECRSNSQFGQNNSSSKNIIFVLATDIISNDIQINIFNEIKNICESRGLNVLIKNHPNSNFRLPCPTDWQSLSPYIPFEVLELPYLLKIGLFSTTLTFQSEKSLSIVNLIDNISLDMKKRIKHNCVLLDSEIFSPNSFKEFELVIDKILSNEAN